MASYVEISQDWYWDTGFEYVGFTVDHDAVDAYMKKDLSMNRVLELFRYEDYYGFCEEHGSSCSCDKQIIRPPIFTYKEDCGQVIRTAFPRGNVKDFNFINSNFI